MSTIGTKQTRKCVGRWLTVSSISDCSKLRLMQQQTLSQLINVMNVTLT